MVKRSRYLLGLGFILGWYVPLLEGFTVSSSLIAPPRTRPLARKSAFTNSHFSSTCRLLASTGENESGGNVANKTISEPTAGSVEAIETKPTKDVAVLPLAELLGELDRRNIRYPPSASRNDLEQLLDDAQSAPVGIPLKELIAELDSREIRYPPTASRQELEGLLDAHSQRTTETTTVAVENEIETTSSNYDRIPVTKIHEELDRRDVRYPPTASRAELEVPLHGNETADTEGRSDSERPHMTASSASPRGSTQSVMNELNNRGILYKSTATRAELVELLAQSASVNSSPADSSTTEDASRRYERMPLKTLLAELERQNIRYSPASSIEELEKLLHSARASETVQGNTFEATARDASTQRSSQSISGELDERNIRFSPTAIRTERDEQLSRSSADERSKTSSRHSARRMPLKAVIAELDHRDIRYPPTATRVELEELLRNAPVSDEERRLKRREQRRKIKEDSEPIKTLFRKSTRVAAKGVQKLPRKVSKVVSSTDVKSRLSKVAEKAGRQARKVKRRASDFWREDEDRIREPDWFYVSQDTPIDVPAVRLDEDQKHDGQRRKSRSQDSQDPLPRISQPPRRREPTGRAADDKRPTEYESPRRREAYSGRSPDPRQARSQARSFAYYSAETSSRSSWQANGRSQRRRKRRRPVPREEVGNSTRLILPPSSQDAVAFPEDGNGRPVSREKQREDVNPKIENMRVRKKRRSPPQARTNRRKTIYSPYPKEDNDEDAFDRFGNLIADTADRFLWGPDDQEGEPAERQKPEPTERTARKEKPRYWKDRLAEQIDYALGIHEDGKYYNSWQEQLDREQERERREGPRPWESPSRKRQPSKRAPKYEVPFWEDEGNLFSLLLGRRPSGGKVGIEKYINRVGDNRMLTTFFHSAFKTMLMVATYICRWASVRGTIPQPIIVTGVTSALLCARPRRRLWTVSLALLGMRTVGELVHGYLYGDEDWEEDDDDFNDQASSDSAESFDESSNAQSES